MTPRETIKLNVVAESGEDFVGIWEVLRDVQELLGIHDGAAAKAETLSIVRDLLEADLIVPGFPIGLGPGFQPWRLPPDEAVSWMKRAWDQLREEPFTGDICWFISTDKGKAWVVEQ